MCSFKSVVVLKDRVFCPDYDSHEKMLNELKLKDDYIGASKTFVRVELSPTDGRVDSDVEGWRLKVDQDITPDWWDKTADLPRIKAAVKAWCDKHVLKEGKHEVHDGVWYAYDSATVIIGKYVAKACSVTVKDDAVCIDRRSDTITTARAWHYQGSVIAESEHAVPPTAGCHDRIENSGATPGVRDGAAV